MDRGGKSPRTGRPSSFRKEREPNVALFDVTQRALEQAVAGAGMRQQAIADNIANANTPGYKRVDVDFRSALSGALAADDPSSALDAVSFAPVRDSSTTGRADGNNVDIDQEMSSMSAN